MDKSCGSYGGIAQVHTILAGKPEGTRPLGRLNGSTALNGSLTVGVGEVC
jgi:hypothetical protein